MNKELTKEEILDNHIGAKLHANDEYSWIIPVMDEWATQQSKKEAIAFAEFLEENTTIIREEKITLYRYFDGEQFANYIIEDIYQEFKR